MTFEGIKNWARAIFISPSIFYASHPCYAERINSNKGRFCVLIEVKVKPNSYTKHNSTVFQKADVDGEPADVEYRVEVKESDDLIYRCESDKLVQIVSVAFVLTEFLENPEHYNDGKIVVNSKEERELLN